MNEQKRSLRNSHRGQEAGDLIQRCTKSIFCPFDVGNEHSGSFDPVACRYIMVTQYEEGCLKSFIMNSFLKIHYLNGTSSIFVGLSSFSVARKPLFVTSPLLSCVGSLWHCPLLFPSKTSPLWFGQPLDFFRSARTSCSTSGGPACPPVPSGYPNLTRYPVFHSIPDPTRFSFGNHRVGGNPNYRELPDISGIPKFWV